ncbi:MAG: PelD GGDEF domain-containing protein [Gammaproteobacteria bacterium]|jgi:hypothetical protein
MTKIQQYKSKLLYGVQDWRAYIEIGVFIIASVLVTYFFNRADPFCIHASFPWIWLVPVLVALRYGTLPGVFVIVVFLIVFFAFDPQSIITVKEYRYATLGGLLLTVFCGEFNSSWLDSMQRFTQLNGYIQKRLDGLNRAFYLLRISHDQLEQSLIGQPSTLRSILTEIKDLLVKAEGKCTKEIAKQFLYILGQYCSMEQAGLHLYQNDKFVIDPIAYIGAAGSQLVVSDPMVQNCLSNDSFDYYAINQLAKTQESKYLAVVLLRTIDGKLCGILAIEKLSFWSLTEETLRTLSIIATYFADDIWAVKEMADFLKVYPDAPPNFAFELKRLQHLREKSGVDSALCAFVIASSARQENIVTQMQHLRRGMDIGWHHQQKDRSILFTLMPFASSVAVEGYRNRFQIFLKSEFGINLGEDKEVYLRVLQIFPGKPLQVMQQLMEYTNRQ